VLSDRRDRGTGKMLIAGATSSSRSIASFDDICN
jgi:hypothetical protein